MLLLRHRAIGILIGDVVGYSRLTSLDEEGILLRMLDYGRTVVFPAVRRAGGRIVRTSGDGFLAEFATAAQTVSCGLEIQEAVIAREARFPALQRLQLRMGANYGDIIDDNGMVYGNTVNIAARLEALAAPNSLVISEQMHILVREYSIFEFEDLGFHSLKNITDNIKIYRVYTTDKLTNNLTLPPVLRDPSFLRIPTVAVLPFAFDKASERAKYLSGDLSYALSSGLSAWRWFGVVSTDTALSYRGDVKDHIQASRELGVRYVVKGSVQDVDRHFQLTLQLIDGLTGHQIWSHVYHSALREQWKLKDRILPSAISAIEKAIQRSEQQGVLTKALDEMGCHDLIQQGYWHYARRLKSHNEMAIKLFSEAAERDPTSALPLAGMAVCEFWGAQWRWEESPEEVLRLGLSHAREAVGLDNFYATAHLVLGQILLFLGRQDAAIENARQAIKLNPSYAGAFAFLGHALTAIGKFRPAVREINRAFEMTAHDDRRFMWLANLALAHFHLGDNARAIREAREAVDLQPNHWLGVQVLAASLAEEHQEGEAVANLRRFQTREPRLTLDQFANRLPYRDPGHLTRMVTALRRAGWDK